LKAGCDFTFLLSQATVFPSGFSEFLLGVNPKAECHLANEGWHVFGISKSVVDKIGYIDTNFWPAYYEDADYTMRMRLAGIEYDYHVNPPVAVSSVGSSSGLGQNINFQALHDYFVRKWGGDPNSEPDKLYKLPFGDKPLTYFPEVSVKELQNRYGN
jgi:hypothetical protein